MPQPLHLATIALIGLLLAGSLHAEIRVGQPYVRATPPGAANSAAFMLLHNTGTQPTQLVGARSSATHTELHRHMMNGTRMQMRPVNTMMIPAGGKVELKPGGYHLMLLGLSGPLRRGESVEMHLNFDNQPPLSLTIPVLPIGVTPQQPDRQHHGAEPMPHAEHRQRTMPSMNHNHQH